MTKVYPNASSSPSPSPSPSPSSPVINSRVLTVWKKSLIFNCDGFTVLDTRGNLIYRVDNYMSSNKGQIFLMDALGTIRRKKLSFGDTWLVFDRETAENPIFVVRKNVNLLNPRCLAHVYQNKSSTTLLYEIQGSYAQRCCAVYDERRGRVAEIKQKEAAVKGVAFGKDVFQLVVHPELDTVVAIAMVILLDQMFS